MKNLKALFWLCLLGAGIYVGWLVFPAYIADYRLKETIDDSARSAAIDVRSNEEDIRMKVYQEARDLNIPLKPEDIKVERSGADVLISANYTVHIDVPVHPFDLEFHPSSRRETLNFH